MKYNYRQSEKECRNKLKVFCTKWENDESDKNTMTVEIDDEFMAVVYSILHILSKPNMRNKIKEYISDIETEVDNNIALLENMDDKTKEYAEIKGRIKALGEVINDLNGRLNELI